MDLRQKQCDKGDGPARSTAKRGDKLMKLIAGVFSLHWVRFTEFSTKIQNVPVKQESEFTPITPRLKLNCSDAHLT